ncbi:MAG: GAF domain-containing protein [Chloroflexi bacterium]|nr:GAF domain-containing protein [Chloroflexota bacterium]MCA2002349.1 GAF domain-containing protein [Chloroflexota bacterium]
MNHSSDSIEFSYTRWRARFLRNTLIGASVFGLAAVIPGILGATSPLYAWLYAGAYLLVLTLTFLPAPVTAKAFLLIGLVFALGILGLSETGIRGDAPLFMLGTITLAALLFSWRGGWAATILAMLTFLVDGFLVLNGMITLSSAEVEPGNLQTWASGSTAVLLLAVVIVNGIRLTQEEFGRAQERAQGVLDILRSEKRTLEQRVETRTRDLAEASRISEYRARMFEAIAQVARAIISTQNLQDLLPQVTQAIHQHFGFYHVGIFLINESGEYAVLSAANSEDGQKMLERNHKLRVGQTGIVGYVAGSGKPRIALDTGADAVYFDNPDLPQTRSEMALPLTQSGGQVIGVLDIQSVEPNAFQREDIEILLTLADQVSIAITNARLYEQTQKTLLESEMLYRQNLLSSWRRFSREKKIAGVRRAEMKSELYAEALELPGARQAIASGAPYFEKDKVSQMTVPVKLRDEVVGLLNVKADGNRAWSEDELDIISAIVERAALSIENVRLLEESRMAAEKERAIGEMSAKIGASAQIDIILKTAVRELGSRIGNAQVSIEIGNLEE